MSNFKRYQSKVFWGQMESLDSNNQYNCYPVPGPRPSLSSTAMAESVELEQQQQQQQQEDVELSAPEDSDQEANTTVIHIEHPTSRNRTLADAASQSQQQHQQHQQQQQNDNDVDEKSELLAERSFSPATSRGQRSQDSGFSDSGRSDSSGTSGLQSPERRRRRRRSSRGSRSQRLALRPAIAVDGPAHTSTPKQEDRIAPRDNVDVASVKQQLQFHSHTQASNDEEQLSSLNSNESEENLNDFLYTSEPVEDDSVPNENNEEDASSCDYFTSMVLVRAEAEEPPVSLWLDELRGDVEDECMATLQSKSLPKRKIRERDEAEGRDQRLLTASATTAAKKVIDAADRFDKRYQQVIHSINGSSKSARSECELLQSFEAEATEVLLKLGSSMPRRVALRQDDPRNAVVQLARLKNSLDGALESRLDFYIEKVVAALDGASREDGCTARGALAALTALGLAGPKAGASIARCSGIRTLLTTLVSASRSTAELRCAILRALASVCCCLESVDQLVRDGGPEILVDVLASEAAPHGEKSEAAALLVQITSPWMEYVGIPYVEPFGLELVRALTELAEKTGCRQTLLLAAAALNHLARSRRCIAAIVDCDSIKRLLRCVKKTNGGNVCLMEQVASLVGQVARVPQARAHLAETRASVALVCFLRMQPPGLEDEYRRLAATTSEALTRLCVDPEIAKQVVAVGGSNFLPEQDEEDREQRFHSTKSLRVARKIAAEQIDIARIWDHSPN